MARPQKLTVNYFTHDVNASNSKTLFILQNKYGNDGYAFWFKLLELLGNTAGHYYSFENPSDWEFLLAKTGVNAALTQEILDTLVNLDAIDSKLLKENKIIWCQNFVDRLEDAYKRREEKPQKPVIANINPVNANNNLVNADINTQSKLNKIKLNNIDNVNNNNVNNNPAKKSYGEFNNVLLTDDEHLKLKEKFPDVDKRIESLSAYLASKNVKYKSHYAVIISWSHRDDQSIKNKSPSRTIPARTEYTEPDKFIERQ